MPWPHWDIRLTHERIVLCWLSVVGSILSQFSCCARTSCSQWAHTMRNKFIIEIANVCASLIIYLRHKSFDMCKYRLTHSHYITTQTKMKQDNVERCDGNSMWACPMKLRIMQPDFTSEHRSSFDLLSLFRLENAPTARNRLATVLSQDVISSRF